MSKNPKPPPLPSPRDLPPGLPVYIVLAVVKPRWWQLFRRPSVHYLGVFSRREQATMMSSRGGYSRRDGAMNRMTIAARMDFHHSGKIKGILDDDAWWRGTFFDTSKVRYEDNQAVKVL